MRGDARGEGSEPRERRSVTRAEEEVGEAKSRKVRSRVCQSSLGENHERELERERFFRAPLGFVLGLGFSWKFREN